MGVLYMNKSTDEWKCAAVTSEENLKKSHQLKEKKDMKTFILWLHLKRTS